MSVFITSITELFQNFFHSDPFKFNEYFAITPTYQKYCLKVNLPIRFTITLAKEAMLIHDIVIHLLAGGAKLTTGAVKGICAIASGVLGMETDHQTPSKQAAVHIGFACVYAADIFVSITNINKTYPQHLVNKTKSIFKNFLEFQKKEITIKYITDPKTEEALKRKQAETQEKELALQKEQRKAKEQDELLKRTQQELENTLNTAFIPNEELEEMFKEAHQAANEKINEEDSIREEPIHEEDPSSLPKGKLVYDPTQFNLTYIEIENDDDTEELWFDDEFSGNKIITEEEKEDSLCSNTISPSEKEKITPQKNTFVIKRSKRKTSSHNNSSQTSAFAIRKAYDKKRRDLSSKELSLTNS